MAQSTTNELSTLVAKLHPKREQHHRRERRGIPENLTFVEQTAASTPCCNVDAG